MSAPFRVALSGDFRKADGSPVYPDFDLEPLRQAANVEFAYLEPRNPVEADQLADFDALILLAHRFTKDSIHPNGRLAVVARFGVGYDTVDVGPAHGRGSRWSSRRMASVGRWRFRSSRSFWRWQAGSWSRTG